MLKFLVLSVFLVMSHQARSPLEIRQYFLTQSMECTKDHSVSSSEMQMLLDHKLPDSKNTKCFIACVFKKMGWMDGKGLFNLDAAIKFSNEEYVDDAAKLENSKKLFEMCKKVNDDTPADGEAGCDRAHSLAKCLMENAPKMGFHINLGTE